MAKLSKQSRPELIDALRRRCHWGISTDKAHTRLVLFDEQFNSAGQVELKPWTPWRNGIKHLVTNRKACVNRLTAEVPRSPLLATS